MDEGFWMQTYGNRDSLMASLTDPALRRFAEINYGPWDRLHEDAPFVAGVGPKPPGANFYPRDLTKAELEREVAKGGAHADSLRGLYTVVRRGPNGLVAVPYHVAYAAPHTRAAAKLREAAALAENAALKKYLTLRADALETDDYQPSDFAWMAMKDNTLDVVIGPIETYEDALAGYKAADEAYVLVKDQAWSARLARLTSQLPALQRALPVDAKYRAESPGTDSDLNAYDALFYAGQANSGAKTIAINLPNDEEVQLKAGSRRLQLKNAMRAKFDKILVPIVGLTIAADQRKYVNFDAFFENTMFHEVAHGLGIKNTVTGAGTVRQALKETAGGLEEEKADILGLWMAVKLAEQGELQDREVNDNFVTFLAGLFRSVRFGASDAHGRANMATFNFLQEAGAFTRASDGTYRVDFPKMRAGMEALSAKILMLQGNGDYAGVQAFMRDMGVVRPQLKADLAKLGTARIPVDIVFEQGMPVTK
ncbi:hypothetical protein J421_0914 [Gemmatirosa kalamazoonensis]|uniref:Zn-dependent hydrolase n=2 Tax=Gemmatirosa kalamazoonensis TaxID=861299 RepID=W0RCD0_9BACT|nr:hypothetical protein J421_0914 [Gemmatirosa kalamazoonensis]